MSRTFVAERGHVGVYSGPDVVGSRTIGLQVEDERATGPSRALLTPAQARELAAELLERVYGDTSGESQLEAAIATVKDWPLE